MSLGHMVGLGAMFITGIVNNPLTLLSRQLDVPLHMVKDDVCELVTVGGAIADKDIDKRIEGEFNQALDILAKWRGEWEDKDESLEGIVG
jgi:lysine-specific histone demethylase 1